MTTPSDQDRDYLLDRFRAALEQIASVSTMIDSGWSDTYTCGYERYMDDETLPSRIAVNALGTDPPNVTTVLLDDHNAHIKHLIAIARAEGRAEGSRETWEAAADIAYEEAERHGYQSYYPNKDVEDAARRIETTIRARSSDGGE